jgi:putative endonuclease
MRVDRRQAWRRGRRAEGLAILALSLAGYRILARNLKNSRGEIDIVARRGRMIAFIEVKTRADWNTAAEALAGRQRRRIARAAAGFLAARPQLAGYRARFDVILVITWRWPRHIINAWRMDA